MAGTFSLSEPTIDPPFARATPFSEQQQVSFPQLLKPCPTWAFVTSPPVSEQRQVLFPSNVGTVVLPSQGVGRAGYFTSPSSNGGQIGVVPSQGGGLPLRGAQELHKGGGCAPRAGRCPPRGWQQGRDQPTARGTVHAIRRREIRVRGGQVGGTGVGAQKGHPGAPTDRGRSYIDTQDAGGTPGETSASTADKEEGRSKAGEAARTGNQNGGADSRIVFFRVGNNCGGCGAVHAVVTLASLAADRFCSILLGLPSLVHNDLQQPSEAPNSPHQPSTALGKKLPGS